MKWIKMKGAVSWRFEYKLQDFWIGVYWEREDRYKHIYLCLIPCLPLHIKMLVLEPLDKYDDV